jgi:endonuclease YncB( thermonuclease family)
MVDTTIKTYATRQAAALGLALALAVILVLVAGTAARTDRFRAPPAAGTIQGPASVVDGDTLLIADARVRLEGIDAPEIGQLCETAHGVPWDCGRLSARVLRQLVAGATVRCTIVGHDRYDRLLGRCQALGREINAEMVRLGFAWAFVRYSQAYIGAEADARAARAGVWSGTAVPAWEYRAARWQ